MNREILKDLLPVMQAFVDGKKIECSNDGENWFDTETPTWNTDFVYRIKPEPKYRPFKTKEECWNEMHKHPDFGWLINKANGVYFNISSMYISCEEEKIMIYPKPYNLADAFKNFTFTDGAPFGMVEE